MLVFEFQCQIGMSVHYQNNPVNCGTFDIAGCTKFRVFFSPGLKRIEEAEF